MPKTKRDMLRRQAAHAYNNLMLAMQHLGNIHDAFEPVHPEMAQHLLTTILTINVALDCVKAFVRAAWCKEEPDWDSWRNVRDRASPRERVEK